MSKLIVTAAICGAEVTRERQPHLPITPDELAAEAQRSVDAGASIIHLHVRRPGRLAYPRIARFSAKPSGSCRSACGPCPSSSPRPAGAVGMSADERLQPATLNPEMATLDCGTVNFGDEIFVNDLPLMRRFAKEMNARRIVPELECFDISHILSGQRLWAEGLISCHRHFDFVLGVPGALDASAASLVEMTRRLAPEDTWTVAGVGRFQNALILLGLAMGGHIRVGFEDNIFLSKGVLADSNARFVERVVRLAREVGREIATPGRNTPHPGHRPPNASKT